MIARLLALTAVGLGVKEPESTSGEGPITDGPFIETKEMLGCGVDIDFRHARAAARDPIMKGRAT